LDHLRMAFRLPPLAPLRLFEAAARHKSFKKAAEELNLTPSAVSHGIDTLEQWLGVALFHRNATRGVGLTESGECYMPYVTQALSLIATGTQRLQPRLAERRIVISAAPTFASRWLAPNLHRFQALYPSITIAIDTSHRVSLLPLEGVDIAIRHGRAPWPGTQSDLLIEETLVPVASPDYVKAHGQLAELDFSQLSIIRVTSVEHDWQAWLEGSGQEMTFAAEIAVDTIHLASEAAAQGLGVAMGRLPLAAHDLAAGRLVALSSAEVAIDSGYWLVSQAGDETRKDVRAFRQWILNEFRSEDSVPGV
jgi:LysR family transcriptional regulator, glycine cleavage system transcriptional activator